jgi:hypothetical protein
VAAIAAVYDARNKPAFTWEDDGEGEASEDEEAELAEPEDEDE